MNDPYTILGISKEAGEEEIKKAYRKLAKKYHPDVNRGNTEAEKRFKEIGEAYKILSDKASRAAYDNEFQKQQQAQRTADRRARREQEAAPMNHNFDIANMAQGMAQGFERYYGFNPQSGEVTREEKLNVNAKKKKNPLDTTALFEQFMGFKK